MKKVGLISLVLVLALGALGVGYAMWTDELFVQTNIETGYVCLDFADPGEVQCQVLVDPGDPNAVPPIPPTYRYCDKNWVEWLDDPGHISCPPDHTFGTNIACACKDIGIVVTQLGTTDNPNDTLIVTVYNAYPYFLAHISVEVHNCGTIPVIMDAPSVIDQDYGLLVDWRNLVGRQIDPCSSEELSFYVGVMQEALPYDDPNYPGSYSFTIQFSGHQWNPH